MRNSNSSFQSNIRRQSNEFFMTDDVRRRLAEDVQKVLNLHPFETSQDLPDYMGILEEVVPEGVSQQEVDRINHIILEVLNGGQFKRDPKVRGKQIWDGPLVKWLFSLSVIRNLRWNDPSQCPDFFEMLTKPKDVRRDEWGVCVRHHTFEAWLENVVDADYRKYYEENREASKEEFQEYLDGEAARIKLSIVENETLRRLAKSQTGKRILLNVVYMMAKRDSWKFRECLCRVETSFLHKGIELMDERTEAFAVGQLDVSLKSFLVSFIGKENGTHPDGSKRFWNDFSVFPKMWRDLYSSDIRGVGFKLKDTLSGLFGSEFDHSIGHEAVEAVKALFELDASKRPVVGMRVGKVKTVKDFRTGGKKDIVVNIYPGRRAGNVPLNLRDFSKAFVLVPHNAMREYDSGFQLRGKVRDGECETFIELVPGTGFEFRGTDKPRSILDKCLGFFEEDLEEHPELFQVWIPTEFLPVPEEEKTLMAEQLKDYDPTAEVEEEAKAMLAIVEPVKEEVQEVVESAGLVLSGVCASTSKVVETKTKPALDVHAILGLNRR